MGQKFNQIHLYRFVSALSHIFSKKVFISFWEEENNLFNVKCGRYWIAYVLLLIEVYNSCNSFTFKLQFLYARQQKYCYRLNNSRIRWLCYYFEQFLVAKQIKWRVVFPVLFEHRPDIFLNFFKAFIHLV